MSKSPVWIDTRAAMVLTSRHRRKESHFTAFDQPRGFIAHDLVQRNANSPPAREALRIGAAARDELIAQRREIAGGGVDRFAALAERFTHGSEVTDGELHPSSSAIEM